MTPRACRRGRPAGQQAGPPGCWLGGCSGISIRPAGATCGRARARGCVGLDPIATRSGGREWRAARARVCASTGPAARACARAPWNRWSTRGASPRVPCQPRGVRSVVRRVARTELPADRKLSSSLRTPTTRSPGTRVPGVPHVYPVTKKNFKKTCHVVHAWYCTHAQYWQARDARVARTARHTARPPRPAVAAAAADGASHSAPSLTRRCCCCHRSQR